MARHPRHSGGESAYDGVGSRRDRISALAGVPWADQGVVGVAGNARLLSGNRACLCPAVLGRVGRPNGRRLSTQDYEEFVRVAGYLDGGM